MNRDEEICGLYTTISKLYEKEYFGLCFFGSTIFKRHPLSAFSTGFGTFLQCKRLIRFSFISSLEMSSSLPLVRQNTFSRVSHLADRSAGIIGRLVSQAAELSGVLS